MSSSKISQSWRDMLMTLLQQEGTVGLNRRIDGLSRPEAKALLTSMADELGINRSDLVFTEDSDDRTTVTVKQAPKA
jgi:hypothetical protein